MNQEVSHQPTDIDPVKLKLEWQGFLPVMSERRKLYQHEIDVKLLRTNTQEDCEALQNERKQYTPSKFWNDMTQDTAIQDLHTQCMFFLELSIMFSFSVSFIERLFSRIKLVTRLQNHLIQVSLESLLRILTKSPSNISDDMYKFFVVRLKRLSLDVRINI